MRHLAMLGLGLAALLAASTAWARDSLTIGITQYPSTLNPSIDSMMAKTYVHGMTRRPITGYGPDWELRCYLCTDLPTLENGGAEILDREDGTRGAKATYTLHPSATWGDGTPVTVDDVIFTWEVGIHPQSGVANREGFLDIVGIEAHDDKTFTVELEELKYDYNALSLQLLPAHLEREIFEADPASYRNRTLFDTDATNAGLGFGPYRLSEVAVGDYLVLERNPTWYGVEPAFDRVVVQIVENTAALEANLLSGKVDMIAGELGLTLDQALAFEDRHSDAYTIAYRPGLVYEHIDLNLDNPILADPRVRQALLYGIDRDALSLQLFAGRQPVADTSIHPLDWIFTEEIPTYERNVEKAKELLEAAGWTEGPNGIRVNAEGEPLRLAFSTTAGNRSRELVQQFLQAQWRDIGVETQIRNLPPRVFFGEEVGKRNFPAMAMFAWISSPESVPRTTLYSGSIPSPENNWAGQNYTGYSNPEMDRLIDAIELELDRDKRGELWAELQRLYATELPALPLYFRANAHIWPHWLEGVVPTGHQFPTTLFIEDWRVEG